MTDMTAPPPRDILLLDNRRCRFGADKLRGWIEAPETRFTAQAQAALDAGAGQLALSGGANRSRIFDLSGGIAYIPVRGPLFNDDYIDRYGGWSGYKGLAAQFSAALADPEVRAILFDIDSPGGVVNGCFDLADLIFDGKAAGKPIWAMANDTATSAAYAIASAAHMVFLPRFGAVGSIGVWTMHMDMTGALEKYGVKITLISSGAHKLDGNPFEPLPDDVRAEMQSSVDHVREGFVEAVARYRGIPADQVRATEAAVFDDRDAVGAGLADAVATDRDVAAALFEELAAIPA